MIDYIYQDKFKEDTVQKNLVITYPGGTLGNSDLYQGEFELNESLCSDDDIVYGSCESSSIKFKIGSVGGASLSKKWLDVNIILDGDTANPFHVGRYYVTSDKETADHLAREIIAFDPMQQLISKEVKKWYKKTLYPNKNTTHTVKEIRDSFFAQSWVTKLGVTQETTTLPFDGLVVGRTITPDSLSSRDVLFAICQLNGVFGHIGRDNKFHYVRLADIKKGLYPSNTLYPANNLFPTDSGIAGHLTTNIYRSCEYESYECNDIDGVQINSEEDDIGGAYPQNVEFENGYLIQGNFLLFGQNTTKLNEISARIYSDISNHKYRPCKIGAKGNPCLELGDAIRCMTSRQEVVSYILTRTMRGIQQLVDTYESTGSEKRGDEVNSVQSNFIQLKNKSNVLTRTVDETRSELTSFETTTNNSLSTLSSSIVQTAKQISLSVSSSTVVYDESAYLYGTSKEYNKIKNRGTIEPSEFPANQTFTVAGGSGADANYYYYLNLTNGKLYYRVNSTSAWTYSKTLKKTADNLNSQIAITSNQISACVSQTGGNESSFAWSLQSTKFKLTANNKDVFVCDKNGVNITGKITATSGTIGGCSITKGVLQVADANISGTISASHLDASVITTSNISAQNINASQITAGTLSVDRLEAKSIVGTKLGDNCIGSRHITQTTIYNKLTSTTASINCGGITVGVAQDGTCRAGSLQFYNLDSTYGIGYKKLYCKANGVVGWLNT